MNNSDKSPSPQQPKAKKIKLNDPNTSTNSPTTTSGSKTANSGHIVPPSSSCGNTETNIKTKKPASSKPLTNAAKPTKPNGEGASYVQKNKPPLSNPNGNRKPNENVTEKTSSSSKPTAAKPKIRRKIRLDGVPKTGNALRISFFYCCCCCCRVIWLDSRSVLHTKSPGLYFSYKIKITATCSERKSSANYRYSNPEAKC
jgi:hypothetical protein